MTPNKREWEREFDELFPHLPGLFQSESGWAIKVDPKRVKTFITQLLSSSRQEAKEESKQEFIGMVNGLKKQIDFVEKDIETGGIITKTGYNKALSDMLTYLKGIK